MRLNRLTPLALVLACAPMTAQDTTGTLVGTARSKSGKPVAGAVVQIASPKLLGARITTTDAKGDFRIPLLPTGTYSIHFSSKGYFTSKGSFTLLAGQVLRQDGLLREEAVQEAEVTVTTSAAQVDKTDTVTQTAMSVESLHALVPASDITALVALSPGVRGGGEAPSIRGGIGVGTSVLMNGGSVKSMVKNLYEMTYTVPDMVESVSVVQSPMNAKLGNTDGGVVSWVTSRGSNEFSGSIRRSGARRNFWQAYTQTDGNGNPILRYANKLGEVANVQQAPSSPDGVLGEWSYTLKGPIWKDHITFAYAGKLLPTTVSQKMWSKSKSDIPQPDDTASTFYRNPVTGAVHRDAQLSPYDGKYLSEDRTVTWNQYNLYWQINPNHQLEYGFTRDRNVHTGLENGAWTGGDPGLPLGTFETDRTIRNIGYKGIVGTRGLLEVRTSQKREAYIHATTKEPGIRTWRGQNYIPDSDTGEMRRPNDILELWYWNTPSLMENGRSHGDHDTLSTFTNSLNYQHVAEWRGTHVIDVGVNDLGSKFEDNNVKDLNFQTWGRLSEMGADAAVAGMYIVVPNDVTIGDFTGGQPWTYDGNNWAADMPWRKAPSWIGPTAIMTRMDKATGPGDGVFRSNNRAYYVNDQWTLDENHSVMLGLRLDHFKFWDAFKTIHSYNQFTPRFEYKWDVKGDQRRVVNVSWGRFAETPHSWYFQPYAQGYLPYRTREYWTGAANPSPFSANPRIPYLVTRAQLLNPANYKFIPGLSTFSMAGGLNEQLNPSMRGPVSTETTIGYRRSFENGTYYRASLVYKTWSHLFDYFAAPAGVEQAFPQEYFPGATPTRVLPRILADNPDLRRTYKGFELEWNFIFTSRVTFGGNYTYSRMTANDSGSGVALENPMAQGKGGANDRNWDAYLNTFVPASERMPESLRSGGHLMNGWFNFDLSTGKLKQSLVIRGRYESGAPYSLGQGYTIPRPTVPGYNDGTYSNTAGLPTSVTRYHEGRGQFVATDAWSTALRYNLEIPIAAKLVWFCSFDVNNWLNHIRRAGYDLPYLGLGTGSGSPSWSATGSYPTLAGGPRLGSRDTRAAESVTGARSVSLETGFRF